ncbi:4'-phosphopantetheinyl transferase family protein [Paenibacillus sp. FJAT-27812]|uniref:4'-phosphopantetheinyl transferase family protein n=1 Tax=Paenibacillus sp. FJAT-27812 TaxID=1684143 RepID=UPI0007C67A9A|nr:4'-phosphopantetheinyl transferase superfamily protein [Paenibacillus sp. FJAT-27812]
MLEIYVLQVPDQIDPELFAKLLNAVSEDKKLRISRFKQRADANRALLADLLIRSIIMEKYRMENQEITFVYNPYGKPTLALDQSFSFNLSHSGTWVAAIVGDGGLVGIDIEEVRPIENDVAKRFFAPEEYVDLVAKGEEGGLSYFYDLWTLKESFIKAVGKGLSIPLDSFVIRWDELAGRYTVNQNVEDQAFSFQQYQMDPHFKLSVCADRDDFPDSVSIYEWSELYKKTVL